MKNPKDIFIVLLFILVIGGVFYAFNGAQRKKIDSKRVLLSEEKKKKMREEEMTKNPSEEEAEGKTLSFPENKIDASDWKIYHNKELGFEVKYPKEWQVTFKKHSEKDILGAVHVTSGADPYTGLSIIVYKEPFTDGREKRSVLKNYAPQYLEGKIIHQVHFTLDGLDGIY